MCYKEFLNEVSRRVEENLKEIFPEISLERQTVFKNNVNYQTIRVSTPSGNPFGDNAQRCEELLYLLTEEEFAKQGVSINDVPEYVDSLCERYVRGLKENPLNTLNLQQLLDPSMLRLGIVCKSDNNTSMLQHVIKREYLDMYVYCEFSYSLANKDRLSIKVPVNFFGKLAMTESEIFEQACRNTLDDGYTIKPMSSIINRFVLENEIEEMEFPKMDPETELYVITNAHNFQGATALFFPEVFKPLSCKLDSDLFILPSSIHECIAVRADLFDKENLLEMVISVNESMVAKEDILTNNVYFYKRAENSIKLIE